MISDAHVYAMWPTCVPTMQKCTQKHLYTHVWFEWYICTPKCEYTVIHQVGHRDKHVDTTQQAYPKACIHVTHRQTQRSACTQAHWQGHAHSLMCTHTGMYVWAWTSMDTHLCTNTSSTKSGVGMSSFINMDMLTLLCTQTRTDTPSMYPEWCTYTDI